eukprot:CAMPEP_0206428752 /NCGR_PEP_ID=MMETSP0324_2-20121206/5850_1 /ASSEMBLY_ACC=CAM_ASM_000836 /TAXON_ID=2866 /ORGANISM="Crypthecodinium cohnii, Strain Seligo" /LENGTH=1228 /DNA_ID=CAMNT_0053894337 /DNA_START=227 /DNA_END=3913 /DNA_ORIENTATION=+
MEPGQEREPGRQLNSEAPPARPAPGPMTEGALSPQRGVEEGLVDRRRMDGQASEFSVHNLPPCLDHEVEFFVPNALNYALGEQVRSETKTVGNFKFKILVFPGGTQMSAGPQVSAFVEAEQRPDLDKRWCFPGVKYQVTMINWLDYRRSVNKGDTWSFCQEGIDRGWHDMVRVAELTPESGWLGGDDNNTLYFRAQCYVRQADHINTSNDYNTKKETGYIGLKNHGATCYMNGLLQSLFHVGEFRKIVYSIPCDEDGNKEQAADEAEGRTPSLIHALQNVFYKLQTSDQAVDCKELMRSFGWDTTDAFTQHDAQELNRILCDRLEEQMKGTPSDGSIKDLFEGEMENYIECINVDYKSKRNETFYDIQLNIKAEDGRELRNIEESLRDFTAEERLDGDNLYEAEGHGKQPAKKGIRFKRFPPVLNLQLKRFHFDLEKMDMVKLNTRFEFQKRLDLSSFAPGAGTYVLYAVLVHNGDVNSGHYYAYIRPNLDGGWLKFDDDNVTPCSEFAAVDDNYAGNDLAIWNYFQIPPKELKTASALTKARIHNAYILVYIREDKANHILEAPDPQTVNPSMVDRCLQEVKDAEARQREKKEQQTKIKIKLIFEKNLMQMTGFWEPSEIPVESIQKMGRDDPVKDLMQAIELQKGVPMQCMALFSLQYRHGNRPVRFSFMNPNDTFRRIPMITQTAPDINDLHLTVLVVAARAYDPATLQLMDKAQPAQLSKWSEDNQLLLIVQYFCPVSQKILTLGCFYMEQTDQIASVVRSGWLASKLKPHIESKTIEPLNGEDMEWRCWEETSATDFSPLDVDNKAKEAQLQTGDVLIWQLGPPQRPADAPPEPERAPDEVPPSFPVNDVCDFAKLRANAVDMNVTLHDYRQPLCVDGVVSNGRWGPPRPTSAAPLMAKKDGQPPSPANATKEESPEEIALSQCVSKFEMPKEKEMKMDLRWLLRHVTGSISREFGLGVPEARIWLFSGPPSSVSDDPLNARMIRNEEPTLKDLLYSYSRRQLHAVQIPELKADPNSTFLCLRFFDSQVREVGCEIIAVNPGGTIQEVLDSASEIVEANPTWGIRTPLRVFEVSDGRLYQKVCKARAYINSLSCVGRSNIFYHSLRVEEDPEANGPPPDTNLWEIAHCDRHSQQTFGQPVLLPLGKGEKSGSIKARCKEKLQVPDSEFKSWRLVRFSRGIRVHLKDDEAWDSEPDCKLYLEHATSGNTAARQSRFNKPLTIRG